MIGYEAALSIQQEIVETLRQRTTNEAGWLLLLEHFPVFTEGNRGGVENLTVASSFLHRHGMRVVATKRGGNITWHGPGQLVGYPIVDLRRAQMGAAEFVFRLEAVMMRVLSRWNIDAVRNPVNRGIWVKNRKIGSIGIAVRHGITYHGFALNVTNTLKPFDWIHPCGLKNVGVTSIRNECREWIPMDTTREYLSRAFEKVFDIEFSGGIPSIR